VKKLITFLLFSSLFLAPQDAVAKKSAYTTIGSKTAITVELLLLAAGIATSVVCKKKIVDDCKPKIEFLGKLSYHLQVKSVDNLNKKILESEKAISFAKKHKQEEFLLKILQNYDHIKDINRKYFWGKVGYLGGVGLSCASGFALATSIILMLRNEKNKPDEETAATPTKKNSGPRKIPPSPGDQNKEKNKRKGKKTKKNSKKKKRNNKVKKIAKKKKRKISKKKKRDNRKAKPNSVKKTVLNNPFEVKPEVAPNFSIEQHKKEQEKIGEEQNRAIVKKGPLQEKLTNVAAQVKTEASKLVVKASDYVGPMFRPLNRPLATCLKNATHIVSFEPEEPTILPLFAPGAENVEQDERQTPPESSINNDSMPPTEFPSWLKEDISSKKLNVWNINDHYKPREISTSEETSPVPSRSPQEADFVSDINFDLLERGDDKFELEESLEEESSEKEIFELKGESPEEFFARVGENYIDREADKRLEAYKKRVEEERKVKEEEISERKRKLEEENIENGYWAPRRKFRKMRFNVLNFAYDCVDKLVGIVEEPTDYERKKFFKEEILKEIVEEADNRVPRLTVSEKNCPDEEIIFGLDNDDEEEGEV